MTILNYTTSTPTGPDTRYALLILTQGFALGSEFMDVVKQTWDAITGTAPFSDLKNLDYAKTSMVAFADHLMTDINPDVDLGIVQSGNRLGIDEVKKNKLRDYLARTDVDIRLPSGDIKRKALEIWPEGGRVGHRGCLVAVIVKGDTPGELYQLTSDPRYPVPLVAVVATGKNWTNVILRGVAQTFANLSDEYELPGPEFQTAIQDAEPRPNVILIDAYQRLLLIGGAKPWDVVDTPMGWGINKGSSADFTAHFGAAPDTTLKSGTGGPRLVEGAAGYRFNALRCDYDCLMRRTPYSTSLPIQHPTAATFCNACFMALRDKVGRWDENDLRRPARILIDSQRPLCDTIGWKTTTSPAVPGSTTFEVGTKPKWTCQVEVNAQQGMRLTDVKLKDRPGDPFAAVETIFKTIEFKDLKVKFAGSAARDLPFSEAFANKTSKPVMTVMKDGRSKDFLGAVRLLLTWEIASNWTIEAVLSVVFKDKRNDFDPGGAAMGAKLYPQLAMRHRRPTKKASGTLPKVEWLSGTIRFENSNIIPTNLSVDHELHHFLTGKQEMTLAVDSNVSDFDNQYDWDKEDLSEWIAETFTSAEAPPWGIWGASWKSGRKLASVADPGFIKPSSKAKGWAGAIARRGHLFHGLPVLPHWSWLFDYVTPLSSGSKRFVAVWRSGETTPQGKDGGQERQTTMKWPVAADQIVAPMLPARDHEMTIKKMGRQGAYDSVHTHPAMGHGGTSIVPAPFCADICTHLHFRWGLMAITSLIPGANSNRPQFLGWGRTGRVDDGANSSPGAPLVPPNQHIEVEVALGTPGTPGTVTYEAKAHDPDLEAWQVFLEQGTGVLFTYDGLKTADLANLGGALLVFDPRDVPDKRRDWAALRASDPVAYDRMVRLLFHEIYQKIRWYDEDLDLIKPNVQQVPGVTGAPAALEGL